VALAYGVRSELKNEQRWHTQKSMYPVSVSILWIKMNIASGWLYIRILLRCTDPWTLKWRIEVICAGYGNTVTCKVICLIICSWWQDTCWYPSHQDLLYHLENWPVHLDRRVCISHQAHRPCPWSPSCEPGMCKTWDIKHSEKEWWNSVSLYVNPSSINSHMCTKWKSLNQNSSTRVLAVIFSIFTFLLCIKDIQ